MCLSCLDHDSILLFVRNATVVADVANLSSVSRPFAPTVAHNAVDHSFPMLEPPAIESADSPEKGRPVERRGRKAMDLTQSDAQGALPPAPSRIATVARLPN